MNYRQPFRGDYPITQKYGEVIPGVTFQGKPHTGIDYACPEGTPILASADGTVMYSAYDPTGYGETIIILHELRKSTLYAHLSRRVALVNRIVKQGDVIGYSGNTGNSTGPHLHFEAREKWCDFRTSRDPVTYLPLMTFADFAGEIVGDHEGTPQKPAQTSQLLEPDALGEMVKVVCPDGAKVLTPDWSLRYAGFPQGTKLHFTGKTAERPGFPYTYCEVYEEPRKYWVAVHDGHTQILDNTE